MKKEKSHNYTMKDAGDRFYVYRDGKLIAGFKEKPHAEIFMNAIKQNAGTSI